MPRFFRCTVEGCGHLCLSLAALVLHVNDHYLLSGNVRFPCPVRGCSVVLKSAENFRKHVSFKHKAEFQRDRSLVASVNTENLSVNANDMDVTEGMDISFDDVPNTAVDQSDQVYERVVNSMANDAGRLRLYVEHVCKLPTGTSINIHNQYMQFALSLQRKFSEVALLRLREAGFQDSDLEHYLRCPQLDEVFKDRTTKKGIESSLDALRLIKPVSLDLFELAGKQPPANLARKHRPVMHYVPILDTLKSYLSHEDVIRCILRESFTSEHLCSFTSGSIFKQHPLFSVDKNALRLHLYTDEVEICNPLGGNIKKHKICCIYFQIGNIGPQNLSSLQSIHLVALVRWIHVCRFGYRTILKQLFADLKILSEDGILVQVKSGGTHHFRGAVAAFVGDNLSMHALGGFRKCFNQGKVCRFCLADYSELNTISEERQCSMRSPDLHDYHVAVTEQDNSLCAVYGVTGKSVLADLDFFQIPYCLPPDAMHDVLETFLPLSVKNVLRGLNKDVLPFARAQQIHANFVFTGVDSTNKHPGLRDGLLSRKYKVQGSASQKLHLFHFFSLIFGPHVPEDNKYWKLHILAHRIVDIVLAMTVSIEMVEELAIAVKEHHNAWVELVRGCYPPKMHYILHYAQYMVRHGPLRHMWCMRFEAFHQTVKDFSKKTRNFINVTKTLSNRIQKMKCLELSGNDGLPPSINIDVTQCTVQFDEVPTEVRDYLAESYLGPVPSTLAQVLAVTLHGLLIKRKCFNILKVYDGVPVFLHVRDIFCTENTVLVLGVITVAKYFDEHLHAYYVDINDDPLNVVCVDGRKLYPGQTLHSYRISNKSYIKVRFTPLK